MSIGIGLGTSLWLNLSFFPNLGFLELGLGFVQSKLVEEHRLEGLVGFVVGHILVVGHQLEGPRSTKLGPQWRLVRIPDDLHTRIEGFVGGVEQRLVVEPELGGGLR